MEDIMTDLNNRYSHITDRLSKREFNYVTIISLLPSFTHSVLASMNIPILSRFGFSKEWQEFRTVVFAGFIAFGITDKHKYYPGVYHNEMFNEGAVKLVRANWTKVPDYSKLLFDDRYLFHKDGSLRTVEELEQAFKNIL